MTEKIPKHILPVIVLAQFAGTSLWFAGNAVVDSLIEELGLADNLLGYITIAVQAGFIIGTLIFALLNIADRFSPVRVFLVCALSGALLNVLIIWSSSAFMILSARLATGIFLAGIYPVGMKIASDWHQKGLGKAMGFLVGALVLGTAFPHFLKFIGSDYPWQFVFIGTSIIAAGGGLLLFLTVRDGPFRTRSTGMKFDPKAITQLFSHQNFRAAALGYFGHMWELYTFWAFVPVMIGYYSKVQAISLSVPLWSFIIIAIGGISCVIGGYLSVSKGSKWVSIVALVGSGICCLLIALSFPITLVLFLLIMLLWGIFVIPDSPQLSTLVAQSSPSSLVATGLTIVNSIGFALTIVSIQLVSYLWNLTESPLVFLIMIIGPIIGLIFIKKYTYNY